MRQLAVSTEAAPGPATVITEQCEKLADIESRAAKRLVSGMGELDRVLGGGLVPGAMVLLAGEPGIGKSTLALLLAAQLATSSQETLYVAAEESASQVRLRGERMALLSANVRVLATCDVAAVVSAAEALRPRLLVVDSIQAIQVADLDSLTGSVSQVREATARLLRLAKRQNLAILIIGHVTKSGSIAGPRVVEHMVDTVLVLEGDRYHAVRLLRSLKNRFGPTNELGVFEIRAEGLVEVADPSAAFLAERMAGAPGSAVTVAMEGSRPLLCEVQALLGERLVEVPQRSANGADLRRLVMITAVLAHRVGLSVAGRDVFVNVVGGLRVHEPAADLALAAAIASSATARPLPPEVVVLGEIGLSGELRSVAHLERRLSEAAKLGFHRAIVPRGHGGKGHARCALETLGARTVREALEALLGTVDHRQPRSPNTPGNSARQRGHRESSSR